VAELTTDYIILVTLYVNAGVVSNVLNRQVVIDITLTPVRHKRRIQFLTWAPKFRWGSDDPPGGGQMTPPWPGLPEPPGSIY